MSSAERAHVFGYGSLLRRPDDPPPEQARPCWLRDHRRGWNVAMDNRKTIPGYKYYVDRVTGERPDVYVTFLNIRPAPGHRVNGVAFPVQERDLDALDKRERNYERVEVTHLLEADLDGRVWAYVGSPEGRRRYLKGLESGTAVVSGDYQDKVRADFGSFGGTMLADFDATTEPPEVPVLPLERISVPEGHTYSGVT